MPRFSAAIGLVIVPLGVVACTSGLFLREMAAVPGGRILLVTDFGSGQLESVDLASLP